MIAATSTIRSQWRRGSGSRAAWSHQHEAPWKGGSRRGHEHHVPREGREGNRHQARVAGRPRECGRRARAAPGAAASEEIDGDQHRAQDCGHGENDAGIEARPHGHESRLRKPARQREEPEASARHASPATPSRPSIRALPLEEPEVACQVLVQRVELLEVGGVALPVEERTSVPCFFIESAKTGSLTACAHAPSSLTSTSPACPSAP